MLKVFNYEENFTIVLGNFISLCLGGADYDELLQGQENLLKEQSLRTQQTEFLFKDIMYHEESQSWISPLPDPYRLENFQKVCNELVSTQAYFLAACGGLKESVISEFKREGNKNLKLRATHYAVKIFPKTEEEQWALESDEQIKVSYVPFDYISVSNKQVEELHLSKASDVFQEEADSRRYTVTYEQCIGSDGQVENITYKLPVLYAVWPCDKPFPGDLDYEILYEVFLPRSAATQKSACGLSADALDAMERVVAANSVVVGPPIEPVIATGYPSGIVSCYDSYLGDYVPMTNLKIRFQFGSNIYEVFTDGLGRFSLDQPFFYLGAVSFVFQDKWRIVYENSTTIITEKLGTYVSLAGKDLGEMNIMIDPSSAPDPRYDIHRAIAFYYNGVTSYYIDSNNSVIHYHNIPAYVSSDGVRIEAHEGDEGNINGRFVYNILNKYHIEIKNKNRSESARLMGTVWHELGHYSQFGLLNGYSKFNSRDKLLKES